MTGCCGDLKARRVKDGIRLLNGKGAPQGLLEDKVLLSLAARI